MCWHDLDRTCFSLARSQSAPWEPFVLPPLTAFVMGSMLFIGIAYQFLFWSRSIGGDAFRNLLFGGVERRCVERKKLEALHATVRVEVCALVPPSCFVHDTQACLHECLWFLRVEQFGMEGMKAGDAKFLEEDNLYSRYPRFRRLFTCCSRCFPCLA